MFKTKSTAEGRKLVDSYLKSGDWIYAGGEFNNKDPRHYNYWTMTKKSYNLTDQNIPQNLTNKCLCNEEIQNDCWIMNKKTFEMLVVGNVCIKKFTKGTLRVCDECGAKHRNRKLNKCNDCKVGYCCDCGKSNDNGYVRCYLCYIKK